MKLLLTILSVLVAYGVAYGLACFVAWEINPMYWTSTVRGIFVFALLPISSFIGISLDVFLNSKES